MNEKGIQILDESGDKKMLWETIGKPAYEKGILEGRQESGLFAIIPMSILENKTLSANAKLLYGEIMALSKKSGLCYATNEYMADMLGLKKASIPQILRELSGCGLIITDIKRSKRGTYRNIMVSFFNKGGHSCKTMGGLVKEQGGGLLDNKDKREIDKIEINNNILESFEKFYSNYPKKVQKTVSLKSFKKLDPDKSLLQVILSDIERRKETEAWKKGGGQFIPYPATYINQKRWEDEYTEPEPEKKPYFRGDPMVKKFNKWFVIVDGDFKQFAGDDKQIEYK